MIHRFGDVEIDTDRRELRRNGRPRPLQPKAFAVLEYLLRHRGRAVPKDELLENLWPGTLVSEGSLQRAVSLARGALGTEGHRIDTVPRHGYRFTGDVETERSPSPDTPSFRPRFVHADGAHIACCTLGRGMPDLVIVPGWVFPMRAFFDHPDIAAWVKGLERFGRVVLFDKRGTGLSDRVRTLPTMEQRIDDLRAVLDAVGSTSALLVGVSEGGPLSILFAATFPERVRGLLVAGSFARWSADPEYAIGWPPGAFDELRRYVSTDWGSGRTIAAIVESRADDPGVSAWAARAEQEGASPGAALDLLEMNLRVDVRGILASVAVPTVVLHSRRDRLFAIENARYLASRIPGARLVEVDAGDHAFFFEGRESMHEALTWLLGRSASASAGFLATVMAVELQAPLAEATVHGLAASHGGVATGVPRAWSFDGPQRAIRCALAVLAMCGGPARAGIHAGEVARVDGRIAGEGLETARIIARAASPAEVWVSGVVNALIPGAPFAIAPRGHVRLSDGRAMAAFAAAHPVENQRAVRSRRGR